MFYKHYEINSNVTIFTCFAYPQNYSLPSSSVMKLKKQLTDQCLINFFQIIIRMKS